MFQRRLVVIAVLAFTFSNSAQQIDGGETPASMAPTAGSMSSALVPASTLAPSSPESESADDSNQEPTLSQESERREDGEPEPTSLSARTPSRESAATGDGQPDSTTSAPKATPAPMLLATPTPNPQPLEDGMPVPTPPASTTPADTMASNDGRNSKGYTTAIIVLAVLLAALVLCNSIACFMFKKSRKKKSRAPPPPFGNGASASAGPLSPPSYAEQQLAIARNDLDAERKRRVHAEALIQRATPGGIRVSDFPNVGEVNHHVEHLATIVPRWTNKACGIAGSDPAMPMTMQTILVQTFKVCNDEVKRCIANRVSSLSDFVGSKEPVSLGGEMNLDTSYVLYECFTRNFESIVSIEPDHMGSLAGDILQRCATCVDERLARQMVFGDAWPLFEAVIQNYIRIFIECALQNGPMLFNDDVGKKTIFDAFHHRDWAPHSAPPMRSNAASCFQASLNRKVGRRPMPRLESFAKTHIDR